MPSKVFTVLGGDCPFGRKCAIDSPSCRQCPHYYRTGTGTFFWCNHPIEQKPAEIAHETPEIVQERPKIARKRTTKAKTTKKKSRPAKKAISKPVKTRKTKK